MKRVLFLLSMLFTIGNLYAIDGYVKVTANDNTVTWVKISLESNYGEYKVSAWCINENTEGVIDLDNVWSKSDGTGTCYKINEISSCAFVGRSKITSVTCSNYSLQSIRSQAFQGCSSLLSISIPNVQILEWNAFYGCSSLKTIPSDRLVQIGRQAFYDCTSLSTFNISKTLRTIEDNPFVGCTSLNNLTVDSSNIYFTIDNGVLYNKDLTILKAYLPCKTNGSFSIPTTVTNIGNYAFNRCANLTSIEIPNSVKSIGDCAFSQCTGLTSVEIPNSVTSIGNYAFSICTGLTSVEIPNSVTSIGYYAFQSCESLSSVSIPKNVTSIGHNAFQYCKNLDFIASWVKEPFAFGSNAFNDISYKCILTVPEGTRDAYIEKGWTESLFRGGIVEADESNIIEFADAKVKAII